MLASPLLPRFVNTVLVFALMAQSTATQPLISFKIESSKVTVRSNGTQIEVRLEHRRGDQVGRRQGRQAAQRAADSPPS